MNRTLILPTVLMVATLGLAPIVANSQSVDLLTGRAQVSLPLYTLDYGGISVPISVYHQGTSLKVEEGEGNCGMGWNLGVGGAVSRSVRGLPDDFDDGTRQGWLFNSNALTIHTFAPTSNDVLSDCTDEAADFNFIRNLGYTRDPEPDLFSFSAPGLSGQFVFGVDGNPKLLSWQDLRFTVTKSASGAITQFVIENNLGVKYEFGVRDDLSRITKRENPNPVKFFRSDYNYYLQEASFANTWYLTKITSAATGNSATFTYGNRDESTSHSYVSIIETATNKQDTIYYLKDRVRAKQLTRISLGAYSVDLTWSSGKLNSLSVSTSGFEEKVGFDFVYNAVRSSTDLTNPYLYRYFLKEITERNSCQPFPPYSFEYESVSMSSSTAVFPWEKMRMQDYWGQYNNVAANLNVPKIYFYNTESDERRFRHELIAGAPITATLNGHDRSVYASYAAFGMIKAINYPRGGRTVFTYEPNTYFDASDGTTRTGPGVRVTKVETFGGAAAYGKNSTDPSPEYSIQRDYEYKQSSGTTSGLLTYPLTFALASRDTLVRADHTLGEQSEVLYSRVVEKIRGKGSIVYEYDLPDMYPNSNATRSRIARSGACANVAGYMKNGRYTFPFAPNPNVFRGYLKKQTEYDSAGTLTKQKRITYTTLTPNNSIVYGLRFERMGLGFHFSKYSIATGTMKVPSQEVVVDIGEESLADSSRLTTAYFYNTSSFMMDSMRTIDLHGNVTTEKIRYVKNYAAMTTPSDQASIAVKQLNDAFRHGEVVERTQRFQPSGGAYRVTGSSLTVYKTFTTVMGSVILPYQMFSFPQKNSFAHTRIVGNNLSISPDYVLTNTIEVYDASGTPVSTTDNHKRSAAIWTRQGYTLTPGASVANATKNQCAYEGFELLDGQGFTGGAQYDEGWTGMQGVQLTLSSPLLSNSISRKGSSYKVSCRVKGATAATLTFKAKMGSTDVAGSTVTLSYGPSTMNTWVYLQGYMNVSAATATFQVQLSTSATVIVDDIVAIPANARISLTTSKPFIGLLSQTDDRGNTETYTYNGSFQRVNTYDRKKNLVENREYLITRPLGRPREPGFKSASPWTGHKVGVASKFSALVHECVDYTYYWTIIDRLGNLVATSSDSVLVHTFASPGQHNVKLTISNPNYGSREWEEPICVQFDEPSFGIKILYNKPATVYRCTDMTRTYSVFQLPDGVHPPQSNSARTVRFQWEVKYGSGFWQVIPNSNVGQLTFTSQAGQSFQIVCSITFEYQEDLSIRDVWCNTSPYVGGYSSTRFITYVDNSPCP